MTKFIDVTAQDMHGATVQWREYITKNLGYDHGITCSVSVSNGKCEVFMSGTDAFQEAARPYGSDHVGRLFLVENHAQDDEWDAICKSVWQRLKKAMPRDERELRASMKMMGGIIERAPSFTSAVGKMIAERIKATRDEATKHMIEHHGWQVAE